MDCFNSLIGIRGVCEPAAITPSFWLNDVPGMDLAKLSALAYADAPTGKKFGEELIDTAIRMVKADIQAMYGAYSIATVLVSGSSLCSFTAANAAGAELGTTFKNNTGSDLSRMVLDSFVAKIYSTGAFTIVITDDAGTVREIPFDFVAGEEVEFTGVNYETTKKKARIYIKESTALVSVLSCPRSGSGCSCTGKSAQTDSIIYTGSTAGAESQQAYGFLPKVRLRCDNSDVLCLLATDAPNVTGLAIVYKGAEQYYMHMQTTTRGNIVAGQQPVDVNEKMSSKYGKLYKDMRDGSLRDIVRGILQQSQDACVICDNKMGYGWAST